jgi:hypothetical protein
MRFQSPRQIIIIANAMIKILKSLIKDFFVNRSSTSFFQNIVLSYNIYIRYYNIWKTKNKKTRLFLSFFINYLVSSWLHSGNFCLCFIYVTGSCFKFFHCVGLKIQILTIISMIYKCWIIWNIFWRSVEY